VHSAEEAEAVALGRTRALAVRAASVGVVESMYSAHSGGAVSPDVYADVCIGTCGLCGGEVKKPQMWAGDLYSCPPGTCQSCKATVALDQPQPVLRMILKSNG
jgi:hypothetical protein